MEKKPEIIDITWDIRRRELKDKITNAITEVKTFCVEHTELALAIGSGVAGAVGWGIKKFTKSRQLHKEEMLKNTYCYDRSLGHYWKLRRELTNNEWVEIDKRKKDGERLADILDSLKVLK